MNLQFTAPYAVMEPFMQGVALTLEALEMQYDDLYAETPDLEGRVRVVVRNVKRKEARHREKT